MKNAGNTANTPARVGDKAEVGANFNSTVKRLFSGKWSEILTEIFQNSQRAGATKLEITIDTDRRIAVFQDNGTGIGDSVDEWRKLFCYTATEYKSASVKSQNAMGVGLLSLLASDMVGEVFVVSGGKKVVIDTNRFWHEPGYWESWTTLIEHIPEKREGFSVGFEVKDARFLKTEKYSQSNPLLQVLLQKSIDNPIIGYTDYLKLSLNGETLDLGKPLELILANESNKWTKTLYKGNNLYFRGGTGTSYINWYGQLISTDYNHSAGFIYYLDVKKGTPLTPKSPTRQGIVQDKKLLALKEFLFEAAFRKLEKLEPRLESLYEENRIEKTITTGPQVASAAPADGNLPAGFYPSKHFRPSYLTRDYLHGLWHRDKTRTQKLSWVEAGIPSTSWYDNNESSPAKCSRIFYYKEIPHFVAETMEAFTDFSVFDASSGAYIEKYDWFEMQFGVSSFLTTVLPDAKVFIIGSERAEVKKIYWKPGAHLTQCFYARGVYGLAPEGLTSKEAVEFIEKSAGWQDLKATTFCFDDTTSYDIMSVDKLVVGAESFEDQIEIIHSDCGLSACFDCGDKDYEDSKYDFDESLDRLARMIDTMRIRRSFDYRELVDLCRQRLNTSDFVIQSIEFKYADKPADKESVELDQTTKVVSGTAVIPVPPSSTDKLIVTTSDDRKVEFTISAW
jgi:hypothetical protein